MKFFYNFNLLNLFKLVDKMWISFNDKIKVKFLFINIISHYTDHEIKLAKKHFFLQNKELKYKLNDTILAHLFFFCFQ